MRQFLHGIPKQTAQVTPSVQVEGLSQVSKKMRPPQSLEDTVSGRQLCTLEEVVCRNCLLTRAFSAIH